jgi:hypothetical protein
LAAEVVRGGVTDNSDKIDPLPRIVEGHFPDFDGDADLTTKTFTYYPTTQNISKNFLQALFDNGFTKDGSCYTKTSDTDMAAGCTGTYNGLYGLLEVTGTKSVSYSKSMDIPNSTFSSYFLKHEVPFIGVRLYKEFGGDLSSSTIFQDYGDLLVNKYEFLPTASPYRWQKTKNGLTYEWYYKNDNGNAAAYWYIAKTDSYDAFKEVGLGVGGGEINDIADNLDNSSAGHISGLGYYVNGTIQGTPYNLPEGVSLTTDIFGATKGSYSSSSHYTTVTSPKEAYNVSIGSGYPVTLIVELENIKSFPQEVVFPAGLIVTSKKSNGKYVVQSGILLKEARVIIPANSGSYRVLMVLYCVNWGITDAWGGGKTFDGWVVTNSVLLLDLIGHLKNKKINVEEYSPDTKKVYDNIYDRLSNIVWSITNNMNYYTYEANIKWINENIEDSD